MLNEAERDRLIDEYLDLSARCDSPEMEQGCAEAFEEIVKAFDGSRKAALLNIKMRLFNKEKGI